MPGIRRAIPLPPASPAAGHKLPDNPEPALQPIHPPAHKGFPGEHPVPSANAGEPVTSRGKRALTASRSIPRETPVLQIRRQSAETLDESIPGSYRFRIH